MYQEEPGSSFTHDGREYDLNYLLRCSTLFPVVDVLVDDLTWVLEYDSPNIRRLMAADLDAPILVTWWNDKLVVLDGLHRMAKAMVFGCKNNPRSIHSRICSKYGIDC